MTDESTQAAPYGIIDPDYARVFTIARCVAWSEGYALTMHGSFTRDLDLLAVPWTEKATEPEHLVRRIVSNLDDLDLLVKDQKASSQATEKPHGRLAWTLTFKAFGDPRFVDLSVMPRAALSSPATPEPVSAPANGEVVLRKVLDHLRGSDPYTEAGGHLNIELREEIARHLSNPAPGRELE
jgi:hypothetical protein